MEYELTRHAQERIEGRKIALEWLEHALRTPGWIEQDEIDSSLEHRLAAIPENGNRVLRVVCRPGERSLQVITAYFDRAMKGNL